MLDATMRVAVGAFELDAALQVAKGEFVAVVGPNGAGKTTLLRAVSGLTPIDVGCVRIDGTVVDDGADVFMAPEQRPLAVVFQNSLLFPHLSALDNVAFGLREGGMRKGEARERAHAWLDRV